MLTTYNVQVEYRSHGVTARVTLPIVTDGTLWAPLHMDVVLHGKMSRRMSYTTVLAACRAWREVDAIRILSWGVR